MQSRNQMHTNHRKSSSTITLSLVVVTSTRAKHNVADIWREKNTCNNIVKPSGVISKQLQYQGADFLGHQISYLNRARPHDLEPPTSSNGTPRKKYEFSNSNKIRMSKFLSSRKRKCKRFSSCVPNLLAQTREICAKQEKHLHERHR